MFINMQLSQYLVSPEDCLILLAIRNTQTLREAARLMECDPGGLLRKVQRIADDHGLLRKKDGKWSLTEKGIALVAWTQETILSQKKVMLSETVLRIASTSWLSECALIPATAALASLLGKNAEVQYTVPDQGLERALIEGDGDFAVACHPPEDPAIAHRQVAEEKWCAVLATALAKKNLPAGAKRLSFSELSALPFVRHHGLNPESFLPASWKASPRALLSVDNLAGIRAALLSGLGWSYVPTALVKKEIAGGLLLTVDTPLKMDRKICLWWLRGSAQARKRAAVMEEWLRKAI